MIVGGAQENTLDSALGLQALPGYDVTLITGPELGPEGNLLELAAGAKLRVITVPSLKRNVSPIEDLRAFLDLRRIFARERFDVVHTHSSKAGIVGRWAARSAGVQRVVHTVHGFAIGPYQGKIRNGLFRLLEKSAARRTDVLVCVADSLAEESRKMGLRPRKEIVCVPSAFDWNRFVQASGRRDAMRQELGVGAEEILVGKIARFFPLKGHDQLFEAMESLFARCPRLRFVLVGGGDLQRHYEDLVRKRGWEGKVLFTGLVAPARVAELLGACDVLVHASLREGLARAIPQAFACSLPVVAYAIDGTADLVRDGETGFLIPPGQTRALADAMARLAADPDLRRRMGRKGHELAEGRYSLDAMVRKLDALYKALA